MKKTTISYRQVEFVETLTLAELSRFCHVGQDWIEALVEVGILRPFGSGMENWQFDPVNVARARKAQHLAQDYGLNVVGLVLVLDLMDERDALKHKLAFLTIN